MASGLLKSAQLNPLAISHYAYEFAREFDREYGAPGYGKIVMDEGELIKILVDKALNSITNCSKSDAEIVTMATVKILKTMGVKTAAVKKAMDEVNVQLNTEDAALDQQRDIEDPTEGIMTDPRTRGEGLPERTGYNHPWGLGMGTEPESVRYGSKKIAEEEHGNVQDSGTYDEEHETHVRDEAKTWAQYAEESDNTDEIKPYDPTGNYFCGTCDMRRGENECSRVEGEINFNTGSCRLYHLGDPETDPSMEEKFSKEEVKYEERETGFGCKRCEYGAQAKAPDAEGRESWCSFWGMHVVPNACCSENEKGGLVQIESSLKRAGVSGVGVATLKELGIRNTGDLDEYIQTHPMPNGDLNSRHGMLVELVGENDAAWFMHDLATNSLKLPSPKRRRGSWLLRKADIKIHEEPKFKPPVLQNRKHTDETVSDERSPQLQQKERTEEIQEKAKLQQTQVPKIEGPTPPTHRMPMREDMAARVRLGADRAKYPDGRMIPVEGDEVYVVTGGFGGTPQYTYGKVIKNRKGELRVQMTQSMGLLGPSPVKKRTYPLTAGWTVAKDPEIKRREDERAAKEKKYKEDSDREMQEVLQKTRENEPFAPKPGELKQGDKIQNVITDDVQIVGHIAGDEVYGFDPADVTEEYKQKFFQNRDVLEDMKEKGIDEKQAWANYLENAGRYVGDLRQWKKVAAESPFFKPDGYLYHGTVARDLESILKDGVVEGHSFWGVKDIADMYSGGPNTILRVPYNRFDESLLVPDMNMMQDPYFLDDSSGEYDPKKLTQLNRAWKASKKTWKDSLRIWGAVLYDGDLPVTKADVLQEPVLASKTASDPDKFWSDLVQENEDKARQTFMNSSSVKQTAMENGWTMEQAWEKMGRNYVNEFYDARNHLIAGKQATMNANRQLAEAYNALGTIVRRLNYLVTGEHYRAMPAEMQKSMTAYRDGMVKLLENWDTYWNKDDEHAVGQYPDDGRTEPKTV